MEKVTVKELLQQDILGKIVCFPTDTVYGVGALIDDDVAIAKIFQMKKRDGNKPLAILTATKDITPYVKHVSEEAKRYMDDRWPGALTLIFFKKDNISHDITKGFPTVAFRMPASKVALAILQHFGLMAVTSVNMSGEKELNTIEDIEKVFADVIDYVVIDEEVLTNVPSSIIDVTEITPKIIRS